MALRNSALRRKFDTLKWTLKKMEQLLYELSLGRNTAVEELREDTVHNNNDKRKREDNDGNNME